MDNNQPVKKTVTLNMYIFPPKPVPESTTRTYNEMVLGASRGRAYDGDTPVSERGALGAGVRTSRRDVRGRPRPSERVLVAEVVYGEG